MKKSKKRCSQPDILSTVCRTIDEHQMFMPEDSVLAGVSGGPDSVALLSILIEISPRFPFQIGVAHLNHSLRGKESDRDEAFAVRFARKCGLPFFSVKKDVNTYRKEHGLSLEDAARRVRYAFLNDICQKHGFNKIALGHHMNDNAELILMHLLRGSGTVGISGIPPVREGKIVRPLMDVTRKDIENFLSSRDLSFVTDSSNTDLDHTRNRIRHDLLPRLENDYNPHIVSALHRAGGILRDENRWMDDLTVQALDSCTLKSSARSALISGEAVCSLPKALQRRVLRKAVKQVKGNLLKITYGHIEQMLSALVSSKSYNILDLPDRIRIIINSSRMEISRESAPLRSIPKFRQYSSFSHEITGPGTWLIPEIKMHITLSEFPVETSFYQDKEWAEGGQHTAFFDMKSIGYPLHVRNPLPGDRFTPLGMQGTQKLSRYFANNKVPSESRQCCPVLLYKNHIIWLAGHRMDDAVRVTRQTRSILKAELMLA